MNNINSTIRTDIRYRVIRPDYSLVPKRFFHKELREEVLNVWENRKDLDLVIDNRLPALFLRAKKYTILKDEIYNFRVILEIFYPNVFNVAYELGLTPVVVLPAWYYDELPRYEKVLIENGFHTARFLLEEKGQRKRRDKEKFDILVPTYQLEERGIDSTNIKQLVKLFLKEGDID